MSLDPTGIVTAVGGFFRAVGAIFGFCEKKVELNNTPAMQQASTAQKEVDETNKDQKAIKEADEKRIVDGTA